MSVQTELIGAQTCHRWGLAGRHLQLMGMGGAIGAGFLLGSGSAIHSAGAGLLLTYLLAGAAMYLMMRALGEVALADPAIQKRFTELGHPSSGGLGTTVLGERTSALGASNLWRPWEGNPLGWGEEAVWSQSPKVCGECSDALFECGLFELSGMPLDERLVG